MSRFISSGLIDKEIYIGGGEFERDICLRCCWALRFHTGSLDVCDGQPQPPTVHWLSMLSLGDFANLYFRHYQVRTRSI